jgi:hypothetical protein
MYRLEQSDLDNLKVRPHVRRYIECAWQLGGQPHLHELRLRRWAHQLGFRGHCFTKSRRYSTTFTALREARERHVHEQLLARSPDALQRALAEHDSSERIASFRYVGRGHVTAADALLAASAAARARENRRIAREERSMDDRDRMARREDGSR